MAIIEIVTRDREYRRRSSDVPAEADVRANGFFIRRSR